MALNYHEVLREVVESLVPVIRKCTNDIDKTADKIHDSCKGERIGKFGGSGASMVGSGLLFTPAAPVGAALVAAGAVTSVASWVGGWAHQKSIYEESVPQIETYLLSHLRPAIEKLEDSLEKAASLNDNQDPPIQDIQILDITLRNTELMWDSKVDKKTKEDWLNILRVGGPVSGLSGTFIKASILTGKAWKAARAAAIKDAILAWKAARAAGDVTNAASKGAAIHNVVKGMNAARATSRAASGVLAGLGTALSVASFAWDAYELQADNPTAQEEQCRDRGQQLKELDSCMNSITMKFTFSHSHFARSFQIYGSIVIILLMLCFYCRNGITLFA